MHADPAPDEPRTVLLVLDQSDVDDFRLMLREQLAGDAELLRDLQDGLGDTATIPAVVVRLAMIEALADQVGGLY